MLVSVNDELVKLFLQNKITFIEIVRKIFSFVKNSEFDKFKKKQPQNANEIIKLSNYVRLKINSKSI